MTSVSHLSLNGHHTSELSIRSFVKKQTIDASKSTNNWSSTEYNSNNSWNSNIGNGNTNNNNKYNTNYVRAVAEFGEEEKIGWIEAFDNCCQNKMTSKQGTLYRLYAERDLLRLASEVKSKTYIPSTSTVFLVTRPKLREIFAANFRDRIVQHWIIQRLNPLLEDKFYKQGNVSFNCRKGFGTLKAVQRLKENIEKVTKNYTRNAYIGKYDLKSFFMSIDIDILWSKLEPYIKANYKGSDIETLLYVTKVTIYHRPQFNCIKRGVDLWGNLDPSKSLLDKKEYVGMPIGNITSQILANFYLSFFDDVMIDYCESKGCTYIRFVDDFVVVLNKKKDITNAAKLAETWLKDNLKVKMHINKRYIQPARHGVAFVGSVIRPNRIYLSNRTIGGLHDSFVQANDICKEITTRNTGYGLIRLKDIQCTLNSYLGFTKYTNSYSIRYNIVHNLDSIWKLFSIDGKLLKVSIQKPYKIERNTYAKYRNNK